MRSKTARPNVPIKRSAVNSTILMGVFVLGMLGLVFVTIGVQTGNPIPIVVWTTFVVLFFGLLLVTRRSRRVTVGFPDRPSTMPGARPRLAVRSCKSCERMIPANSAICPHCGREPW